MKLPQLLPLVLLAFLASPPAPLSADPFPGDTPKLVAGKEVTLRGVINLITVPVPDAVEAEPTQDGFFLITPDPLDAEGEGDDGEAVRAAGQIMFHLAGESEIAAKFEALAGRPVEIVATPFPAHTRHHRTPFLLNVTSLRPLDK